MDRGGGKRDERSGSKKEEPLPFYLDF